jgi:two-component system, OmpR family, response regulator
VSKGNILLIDDSPAVLQKLKLKLEDAGYSVIATTQTVGVARHLANVDLEIIDYYMPGVDGAEVLQSLRAATRHSQRKVSFYLYTSNSEIGKQFSQLGFDGSFSNKGDDDALISQVDAAFRLVRLRAFAGRRSNPG